jgi:hypothetical protein
MNPLLIYSVLNAVVTAVACILLNEVATPILITLVALMQFVWAKQFRLAASLILWQWYYIHQRFIPKLLPDFGILSLIIIGIGFWVGLGIERGLYQTIRPPFIVITGALYLLPFQTTLPTWGMALMSVWYCLLYGLTCWVKDEREQQVITVSYFLMSCGWILVATPYLFPLHVVWTLIVLKAAFDLMKPVTTAPPLTTTTTTKRQKRPLKRTNKNQEFSLKDGLYMGLRLLEEDEFINARLNQTTRLEHAVVASTTRPVIAPDDPDVVREMSLFKL